MMHRGNRLDGSGEGWSIELSPPDGPGWMAALMSRKNCLSAFVAAALAFAVLAAPAAAGSVDERSQRASVSLAARGASARGDGDYTAAQRFYELAIVADPANAAAFTGLGDAHRGRNHLNFARKYYLIALAIEPSDPKALSRLAHLDIAAGNRESATEGLRKLRAHCATCAETQELSRALGLAPNGTPSPSTDP